MDKLNKKEWKTQEKNYYIKKNKSPKGMDKLKK